MIQELQRFISLVHHGSFTRAAKTLHITQPALSLGMKRLEKELKLRLFSHTTPTVVMSKEGQVVYQLSNRIISLWNTMHTAGAHLSLRGSKPFAIGLFDNAALTLAPFFKRHLASGRTTLEITIDNSSKLLQWLSQGMFELVICVEPREQPSLAGIQKIFSYKEELIPVSKQLWRGTPRTIPFILYNKGSLTREYIDAVFSKKSFQPHVLVESTSPAFIKELALSGSGVALLPTREIERELHNHKLILQSLPLKFSRTVSVYVKNESDITLADPFVAELIDFLRN